MKVDTTKKGLYAMFKPYQAIIVKKLVADREKTTEPAPISSRDMWDYANRQLKAKDGSRISRASVINFLNAMVDDGIFGYSETTGKGGYRRSYWSNYTGVRLEELINQMITRTLEEAFAGSWWQ